MECNPRQHEQNSEPLSLIEQKVDEILLWYENVYLQNGANRAGFRALPTRNRKINDVCWNLAMTREADKVNKAVNLRALHIMGWFEENASSVDEGKELRYELPSTDEFWLPVDSAVRAYIRRFADNSQVGDVVEEQINEVTVRGRQYIAQLNDRHIIRETYRGVANNTPHHITYVIQG